MKQIIAILITGLILSSCSDSDNKEISSVDPVNWGKRTMDIKLSDTLEAGTTYLSVYSQIYSQTEHRTHNLTSTISMRNTNRTDTVFIQRAEYFNTQGELIRTYFNKPIFLRSMETVEIVIDEADLEGGTGANFLFEWSIKPGSNEPLFEGVMISTSGQQGLSFTTQGKRVH